MKITIGKITHKAGDKQTIRLVYWYGSKIDVTVGQCMFLQKFKRGRASTLESVLEILKLLTDKIAEERNNLSFSLKLRGWCYLLED